MSRRLFSVTSSQIEMLANTVREVVAAYRATGLKAEHARAQASADLGISERRVTAYVYNEVFACTHDEASRIRAGFVAHLDREAARLTARAEQVRARRVSLTGPLPVPQVVRFRGVK